MARTLATNRYSEAEVRAALTADGRATSTRFEVLDNRDQPVEPYELTTVTAASVDWDGDRSLSGSLQLTMMPEPSLLNQFLRRRIKPFFRLKMPDDGWAEWPMGLYVWTRPSRTVTAVGDETWSITMGDLTHLLDLGGPGGRGFWAGRGSYVFDVLKRILDGVSVATDHLPVGTGVQLGADAFWDLNSSVGGAQTWLAIVRSLNASGGLWWPWFDPTGRYNVDRVPDLRYAAADIVYETGEQSIVSDFSTDARLELFANRVRASARNLGGGPAVFAEADADVLLPGHPGARNQIGIYVDKEWEDIFASTPQELAQNARADLFQRISLHQNVTVAGWLNPEHEGFDVCSMSWAEDAEFGQATPTRFLCRSRRQDLMRAEQSIVLYTLAVDPFGRAT